MASATVKVDDAFIDADGNPDPDIEFESSIIITTTGPGRIKIDIWRGADGADSGRNPWRSSEDQFPDGIREADSPVVIATGGPVKRLDDISWRSSVRNT